ncbi:amino acid ABC transporter permease [Evansella tamaricis]|uniref:ABC transporter permease subunit n=1 Tax=Evansella tamaricis TaxID=2069301 RepID=A0ABS6JG46_9BACI|nr:ABC transporter permease subunit [Evansella tamaricis]MBU9712666.1 ABC transporter permease subunit [Evansella tamaricis]
MNQIQYEKKPLIEKPPKKKVNILEWLKDNLFSSWINTLFTIGLGILVFFVLKGTLTWVFFSADWSVVSDNFKLLLTGQYPIVELWRVWVCILLVSILLGFSGGIWNGTITHLSIFLTVLFLISGLLPFVSIESRIWNFTGVVLLVAGYYGGKKLPIKKTILLGWFLLFPITIFLLNGFDILTKVGTNLCGGFLLTLLLAIVSIVFSFPIGVLLALGRRSKLPVVKYFCIGYIEFIRGIPLITILFVAQIMLPLFLGQGLEFNNVVRAMIGMTLFNAAYLAENVRGGLQSIPRGQFEASHALGFNSSLMTFFIILPQALRTVIPAMVGQFIAIFKDTSLVTIVGLIDILGMAKTISQNPEYLGKQMELFLFVAAIFFVFCYMLSYSSRRIENSLGVGKR